MGSTRKHETEPVEIEEVSDEREVYLRDGRKLVVSDEGRDQLVEIRNESGMLELRIKLTEAGPVLQMESVRLQLKASEAVEIESPRVEITASEQLELAGGEVHIEGEQDVKVDAKGEVRVVGKMIWLN
jgi:phage gp45-like